MAELNAKHENGRQGKILKGQDNMQKQIYWFSIKALILTECADNAAYYC
jgi:hypothetical protein